MAKQKMPAKLGEAIDMLYQLRAKRLERQKEQEAELAVLKSNEEAIKQHILNTFEKSEIEGAKGKVATAAVTTLDKYRVGDMQEVWDFAKKHDAPQLFEKRLTQTAVREFVEDGIHVPGVEVYTIIDLSLTKVG